MFNTYQYSLKFLAGFEDRSCSLATTTQDGICKIVVEGGMEFFINQFLHQELASIFGPTQQLQVKSLLRQVRTTRLLASPDPVTQIAI